MAINAPRGLCFFNAQTRLAMITIPKCASSTLRKGLNLTDCVTLSTLDNGKYKSTLIYFAVIRNPIERFVSGFIEILRRGKTDSPHILDMEFYKEKNNMGKFLKLIETLEDVVEKDGHIQQQSFFISPPLNPTFLLRQENLEGDLNVFLGKNRFPLVTVRRINTTDPDEHSLYLNKLLTDSDLMSKVMAVYEQDIHLFQSLSVEKNKTI